MTAVAVLRWCEIDSPVGPLLLAGDEAGLRLVHFQGGTAPRIVPSHWVADPAFFASVCTQLGEYFARRRREFDVPLAPAGTPFQCAVWQALLAIPYGETWSYGELARRIGLPGGARAVGLANGANPLPIIIPCHRVIGADGSLTGFGGGLPIKRALLALEGAARSPDLFDGIAAHAPGGPGLEGPGPHRSAGEQAT